ncbi:DUF2800 domain-containing protein [Pedobacter sp.]
MAAHALLSPSGASRWLTCTPSARLEQKFPDKAGAAAAEGTLAHALGELLIRYKLASITTPKYKQALAEIKADKQFEKAMLNYMEEYASYVLEQFNSARQSTSDAALFLEQKLNLTDYVPDGFGTGDVVIIADGTLDIIDLKYGKGVPVSALENKQMMLYALGALRDFDYLFDIQQVRMTIYQPRLDSISVYEMAVKDLKEWAEKELKPKAMLAFEGKGDFVPSENCRFCKAKATCKANADQNLELAKYDFKDPELLNDNEISDILKRADTFVSWINSVSEHALNEAINNGKQWPEFKLVEGRSNRMYIDETKVAETLVQKGFTEEEIFTPKKLLGITAMEKAISKTDFNRFLSDLVVKPPGKPTLVPQSDKRPEYNSAESAAQDFAEVINEN